MCSFLEHPRASAGMTWDAGSAISVVPGQRSRPVRVSETKNWRRWTSVIRDGYSGGACSSSAAGPIAASLAGSREGPRKKALGRLPPIQIALPQTVVRRLPTIYRMLWVVSFGFLTNGVCAVTYCLLRKLHPLQFGFSVIHFSWQARRCGGNQVGRRRTRTNQVPKLRSTESNRGSGGHG